MKQIESRQQASLSKRHRLNPLQGWVRGTLCINVVLLYCRRRSRTLSHAKAGQNLPTYAQVLHALCFHSFVSAAQYEPSPVPTFRDVQRNGLQPVT